MAELAYGYEACEACGEVKEFGNLYSLSPNIFDRRLVCGECVAINPLMQEQVNLAFKYRQEGR